MATYQLNPVQFLIKLSCYFSANVLFFCSDYIYLMYRGGSLEFSTESTN